MRAFLIWAILIPVAFPCAANASALSSQPLSDQDLAANVSGPFVVVAFHASAKGNQTELMGGGGSMPGNFVGIQTIRADTGLASVSQAAAAVTIRAELTIRANWN